MEIPLTKTQTLFLGEAELKHAVKGLYDTEPNNQQLLYTIGHNIRKVYKKIMKEDFLKLNFANPWDCISLILLASSGIKIPATMVTKAIESRKVMCATRERASKDFLVIKNFMTDSLKVSSRQELAGVVKAFFIAESNQDISKLSSYVTKLNLCVNCLENSVLNIETDSLNQWIKRLCWEVVNVCGGSDRDITKDRLVKRCNLALLMLNNIISSLTSQGIHTPSDEYHPQEVSHQSE